MEAEAREAEEEAAGIRGRLRALQDHHQTHLTLLESGVAECPTCGQPVNPAVLKELPAGEEAELENLRKELAEAERRERRLAERLDEAKKLEKRVRERRERLSALLETFRELEEREEKAERVASTLQRELSALFNSMSMFLDPADPKLLEKLAQIFPASEALEEKRRKLKALEKKLEERERLRDELSRRLEGRRVRLKELEQRAKAAALARGLKEKLAEAARGDARYS